MPHHAGRDPEHIDDASGGTTDGDRPVAGTGGVPALPLTVVTASSGQSSETWWAAASSGRSDSTWRSRRAPSPGCGRAFIRFTCNPMTRFPTPQPGEDMSREAEPVGRTGRRQDRRTPRPRAAVLHRLSGRRGRARGAADRRHRPGPRRPALGERRVESPRRHCCRRDRRPGGWAAAGGSSSTAPRPPCAGPSDRNVARSRREWPLPGGLGTA